MSNPVLVAILDKPGARFTSDHFLREVESLMMGERDCEFRPLTNAILRHLLVIIRGNAFEGQQAIRFIDGLSRVVAEVQTSALFDSLVRRRSIAQNHGAPGDRETTIRILEAALSTRLL